MKFFILVIVDSYVYRKPVVLLQLRASYPCMKMPDSLSTTHYLMSRHFLIVKFLPTRYHLFITNYTTEAIKKGKRAVISFLRLFFKSIV